MTINKSKLPPLYWLTFAANMKFYKEFKQNFTWSKNKAYKKRLLRKKKNEFGKYIVFIHKCYPLEYFKNINSIYL